MPFSYLPPLLATAFSTLGRWLDRRSAARVPLLLFGILLASGRRTCTSWFRAADIGDDFRLGYCTLWSCGRKAHLIAIDVFRLAIPMLPPNRLLVAIDDTPSKRYGPCIEGAGKHHNPTPGPEGSPFYYGHNWVNLSLLAKHPYWGTLALPLLDHLYIRRQDIDRIDPDHRVSFKTKLQQAAEQLQWLRNHAEDHFEEICVVVDGAYCKRPFLKAAHNLQIVVIGRLPRNAALFSLPETPPPGRRGRKPIYGKERIVLSELAQQKEGWQEVTCQQYRQEVTKMVKTFLATWRPAGGAIRVVLVQEEDGWRAYFSPKEEATVQEILEGVADRGAQEEGFRNAKEVWRTEEQQLRNLHANVGSIHLNNWMQTMVELWAWDKDEEDLVDRSKSPWDSQTRRPSHQDKRKALQRQILRDEFEGVLGGNPTIEEMRALMERCLDLAA